MLVWTYGKNAHTPGPGFGLDAWQHAGPKYIWVRDIRPLGRRRTTHAIHQGGDGR